MPHHRIHRKTTIIMGEPAPNAGYRGGTRPQRGLLWGNPMGEPAPARAINNYYKNT